MSTYYRLYCETCKEAGGWFSRQAWGWGNAESVATVEFLMAHTATCGGEHFRAVSEHEDEYGATSDTEQRVRSVTPLVHGVGTIDTYMPEKWTASIPITIDKVISATT